MIKKFKADYLVAYQSHLIVEDSVHHFQLLKNITEVLFSLPKEASIYVKPHNVKDEGNRISKTLSNRFENKGLNITIPQFLIFVFYYYFIFFFKFYLVF